MGHKIIRVDNNGMMLNVNENPIPICGYALPIDTSSPTRPLATRTDVPKMQRFPMPLSLPRLLQVVFLPFLFNGCRSCDQAAAAPPSFDLIGLPKKID